MYYYIFYLYSFNFEKITLFLYNVITRNDSRSVVRNRSTSNLRLSFFIFYLYIYIFKILSMIFLYLVSICNQHRLPLYSVYTSTVRSNLSTIHSSFSTGSFKKGGNSHLITPLPTTER